MAEAEHTTTNDAPDLAEFVPESYKSEDGAWDVARFRADYDDLTAFKAQAEEGRASLPEKPEDFEFGLPEGFELPEGFDAEGLAHVDADGNQVEFDPASLIDSDDPDIPQIKALMHRIAHGETDPQSALKEIAGLVVNRELRGVMDAQKAAAEERKALGPDAQSRISSLSRALKAKLPEAQATAVLDSISSAAALRGLEHLLNAAGKTTAPAPQGKSLSEMSPMERLMAGLKSA